MWTTFKKKLIPLAFYLLLTLGLGLIGYFYAPKPHPLTRAFPTSSKVPAPGGVIELSACEDLAQQICLRSTGFDAQGDLLISLKVKISPLPGLLMRVKQANLETRLICQPVEFSPGTVYCLGPYPNQAELTRLELYSQGKNLLLAAGEIPAGELVFVPVDTPEPVLTEELPTGTPEASYPNNSYPNNSYPSYP